MTNSKFLKLKGFQTRIRHPQTDRLEILKLLTYISQISGMKIPEWGENFLIIPAIRTNVDLSKILHEYKTLDEFLIKEEIFSYALTYKNIINYTKFDKKQKR